MFALDRGQILSIDMNISLFLFVAFVLASTMVFNHVSSQLDDYIVYSGMVRTAVILSDTLVRSPGYPANWNSTNVMSVGLAEESNIINGSNLLKLGAIPYQTFKERTGIEDYDILINITSLGGQELFTYGPTGFEESTQIFPLMRLCILDNGTMRPVHFSVVVWK